jgi:hypothetical protein
LPETNTETNLSGSLNIKKEKKQLYTRRGWIAQYFATIPTNTSQTQTEFSAVFTEKWQIYSGRWLPQVLFLSFSTLISERLGTEAYGKLTLPQLFLSPLAAVMKNYGILMRFRVAAELFLLPLSLRSLSGFRGDRSRVFHLMRKRDHGRG